LAPEVYRNDGAVNCVLLRYTQTGFLVLLPQDNPNMVVDAILETGYNEDFCISPDFSPDFISRLMQAGFLVMSSLIDEGQYVLLPKLHTIRSVLLFNHLHIKKSASRILNRYDLRFNADFDRIVDRCIAVHGADWLTPPLVDAIRTIRGGIGAEATCGAEELCAVKSGHTHGAYPASFALYRNGELVAGEFGIIAGRVYTSYSGYYDESNAGTAQLILTTRYLQENGFSFFDLGMPLDYKTDLGAINVSDRDFVRLFRAAQ